MKNLQEILSGVTGCVDRYHTCKLSFVQDQSEILRDLSTYLYYLTQHYVDYKEAWMKVYMETTGSNAKKEREADFYVPELFTIKHILAAGTKVQDSIRSTLSANKNG